MAPPKIAIAICGANAKLLVGSTRYKAETTIKRMKETKMDLLNFIISTLGKNK
jgi:hypothetical protein